MLQSDDESSSESLSLRLTSVRVPYYGTDSARRIIPIEERISYGWSQINAFASTHSTSRKRFPFFWRSSQAEHRKHILKNGNGPYFLTRNN